MTAVLLILLAWVLLFAVVERDRRIAAERRAEMLALALEAQQQPAARDVWAVQASRN